MKKLILIIALVLLFLSGCNAKQADSGKVKAIGENTESGNEIDIDNIRVVYLPPATVASINSVGNEPIPEDVTVDLLFDFIESSNLSEIKPDFRHFGFNIQGDEHGYERWVTIPDDMEVPTPLEEKQFEGGLYVAYTVPMDAFYEWQPFIEWVNVNEEYEIVWEKDFMEEHLNSVNYSNWTHLDLLIPIKDKQ